MRTSILMQSETGLYSSLDASDRLQPRAGMNFSLRQNRGLRPEPLHQRAHEGADRCRGDQYRRLAFAGGMFETATHRGHEPALPGRLHRKAAFLSLTEQRLGKSPLPL